MSDCLRCGRACETGLFCQTCQNTLRYRLQLDDQESEKRKSCVLQDEWQKDSDRGPTFQGENGERVEEELLQPCKTYTTIAMTSINETPSAIIESIPNTTIDEQEMPVHDAASAPHRPGYPIENMRHLRIKRIRRAFIALTILAIVALVVDSILIALVFNRHHNTLQQNDVHPMVTLSPGIVYPGQIASLRLRHFSPSAHVLLRRNIDETVHLETGASHVQVNAQGEADVRIVIGDNWESGHHYIEAEDLTVRFVASVAVQVIGAGPAQPAHLQVSHEQLDLGHNIQGANTLQSVTLQNTGDGQVSWTAWTDQSWLSLTPTQGTFSSSQRVVIGASRARLSPGKYTGRVTFASSTGTNIPVHITMEVTPRPDHTGADLVVTPPTFAFTAVDNGNNPGEQRINISNPGNQPLHWSMGEKAPTVSVNQSLPLTSTMDWLEVSPQTGVVKPGEVVSIHLRVHTRSLLPAVYSGVFTLTGAEGTLNTPQAIAVSLTIQPRCGITASTGQMIFQSKPGRAQESQQLALGVAPGCVGSMDWRATSLAPWLTITPAGGKIVERTELLTMVSVNSTGLKPGSHQGFLVFLSDRRTQTVEVRFSISSSSQRTEQDQAPSSASTATAPGSTDTAQSLSTISLSRTVLNFDVTQGDTLPASQSVILTNTGNTPLTWQAQEDQMWLRMATPTGSIASGDQSNLGFSVDSQALEPGIYHAQVTITVTDSTGSPVAGNPLSLSITLHVTQSCSLSIEPTELSFQANLLTPESSEQQISIKSVGHCTQPVIWNAQVDEDSRAWLLVTPLSGSLSALETIVNVHVKIHDPLPTSKRGQITFSAFDGNNTALRHNSQTVSVSLVPLG